MPSEDRPAGQCASSSGLSPREATLSPHPDPWSVAGASELSVVSTRCFGAVSVVSSSDLPGAWSACCPLRGPGWGLQGACPASFLPACLQMCDPHVWVRGLGTRAIKPSLLMPRGLYTLIYATNVLLSSVQVALGNQMQSEARLRGWPGCGRRPVLNGTV